jgi:hypothetical protein
MPPEMEHERPTVTFTEAPYLPLPLPPLEEVTFPLPPMVAIERPLPANQPGRSFPFVPIIPIIPTISPPVPVAGSFAPLPARTPVVRTPVVAIGPLVTPEPGTVWLTALALGGLALLFGRNKD